MSTKKRKAGAPSPAPQETPDGGKSTPSARTRKRVTFTMDYASVMALNCVAHELRLSQSDVVRRLVYLALGAVMVSQNDLPADADDETKRRAAEAGCKAFGLFTLGHFPVLDPAAPPVLRVIRGGAGEGGDA